MPAESSKKQPRGNRAVGQINSAEARSAPGGLGYGVQGLGLRVEGVQEVQGASGVWQIIAEFGPFRVGGV